MSKYRAVIIGCGGVGGLSDSPGDKNIISHAFAYHSHDSFELVAGCDVNQNNLAEFKKRWGSDVALYSDVDELIKIEDFEVASISSTTETHAEIIKKLLNKKELKLLVCEKPLVATIDELNKLKNDIKNFPDKKLIINFPRRYDPGFTGLAKRIKNNEFGRPLSFSGLFTKGLYHNGCHTLELIEYFMGDIKNLSTSSSRIIENDLYGLYSIETTNCCGTVLNFEPDSYSIFEIDFFFEKGRIRLTEGGHQLEIHKPSDSKIYPGYTEIYLTENIPDSFTKRMYHTIEAARSYLEDDKINGRNIFEKHLRLSEKLLIIKDKFCSNKKTVTFE